MSKKGISLMLLALVTCIGLLAGCGKSASESDKKAESTTETVAPVTDASGESSSDTTGENAPSGDAAMTDGYYFENTTGLNSFYHFNEDGSYYGKFFDGGVVDAGTWKLLDEAMEYSVNGGADDDFGTLEDNEKATAPQVIELTSYLNGSVLKIAYDNDKLCDTTLGGMAGNKTLEHKADYEYVASVEETPIIICEFYANGSVGSMLTLNHDRTFGDTTGDTYLNGTWEMTDATNYTLTYTDGSTAQLSVSDNKKTAEMTLADGTVVALADSTEPENENAMVLSLEAKDAQVGLPMGVDVYLNAYSDGACELAVYVAAVDATLIADTGTYTVDAAMQFVFIFDNAGEIAGTPDYESATESGISVSADYAADVTVEFNGTQTPLSINSTLSGTYQGQ